MEKGKMENGNRGRIIGRRRERGKNKIKGNFVTLADNNVRAKFLSFKGWGKNYLSSIRSFILSDGRLLSIYSMYASHLKLFYVQRKDDFQSVMMEHIRMISAYWGLTTLDILGKLDTVDIDEVVSWVLKCQHESGGFSGNIGRDPHILYTLSAVQVLALFDKLNVLDVDKVCYSWWVLSSLIMIDRVHWINKEKLIKFILDCQDTENGGISDRPDDAVDVYHTYFGIAGLSFLEYPGLKAIDPVALPVDVVNRILLG